MNSRMNGCSQTASNERRMTTPRTLYAKSGDVHLAYQAYHRRGAGA
jgi:hypothetical protein